MKRNLTCFLLAIFLIVSFSPRIVTGKPPISPEATDAYIAKVKDNQSHVSREDIDKLTRLFEKVKIGRSTEQDVRRIFRAYDYAKYQDNRRSLAFDRLAYDIDISPKPSFYYHFDFAINKKSRLIEKKIGTLVDLANAKRVVT